MVEYREVPEQQRSTFFEYSSYAFRPENGPEDYDPETDWPDLDQYNGLYEDGVADDDPPLSICGHQWYDGRIRGDAHPMPGLTAVATPPERRRRGLGRRLLEHSLADYRDRDVPITILWPFRTSYYREYGWEVATELTTYTCPPDSLAFAADATDGTFRRIENEETCTALDRVYSAYASDYALSMVRDEEWWRNHALSGANYVYVWERDGVARGYLRFGFDGGLGERTMHVTEFAYTDHEAYRHLLRFCHNHKSQVETIRLETPADDDLLALVTKPEDVELQIETGPMVRIVSVIDALASLSYPDVETSLALAVDDPLVEWNEDTFRLDIAAGDGRCRRTDERPDARIDVGALSQLVVGYRSARALARTGRLETTADDAVESLERLFPPTTTYFRQKF